MTRRALVRRAHPELERVPPGDRVVQARAVRAVGDQAEAARVWEAGPAVVTVQAADGRVAAKVGLVLPRVIGPLRPGVRRRQSRPLPR